jgi:hypothetical protein
LAFFVALAETFRTIKQGDVSLGDVVNRDMCGVAWVIAEVQIALGRSVVAALMEGEATSLQLRDADQACAWDAQNQTKRM